MQPEANSDNHPKWTSLLTEQHQNPCLLKHLKPSTQCIGKLSGPKLMGNNCSNVRTVDLPSLSYIKTGIEGYKSKSQHKSIIVPPCHPFPDPSFSPAHITHLAKLPDILPTHSTRRRRRRNIGGDGQCADISPSGAFDDRSA
jgi:hypothetical protein